MTKDGSSLRYCNDFAHVLTHFQYNGQCLYKHRYSQLTENKGLKVNDDQLGSHKENCVNS